MATKGFTKISNSIIFDSNLSLEALGLYIKLQHLSTIENFSIRREHIKSISGYGETAFRRVWKELKDKGILVATKIRIKGKFEYIFNLSSNQNKTKANESMDKQTDVDEIVHESVKVTKENIVEVKEATGFTDSESIELLKLVKNDVHKIIEYYQYTLRQKGVKNIFAYTKSCIVNKVCIPKENFSDYKELKFNNFTGRKYDFDKLENALLYGEPYELPI